MTSSPFPPNAQVPLHKNTPLAPSQELAYRQKCIDLRRRLNEITQNNDVMRARISRERAAHDKMRLNRAILLHHLKNVIDGKPLNEAEAEALRRNRADGNLSTTMGYDEQMTGIDGNARSAYLDEDTENSDEDEIPEVNHSNPSPSSEGILRCLHSHKRDPFDRKDQTSTTPRPQ